MGFKENKPICDMVDGCCSPITHIDLNGYIFCASHGKQRQAYTRCRKLTAFELKLVTAGHSINSYKPSKGRTNV